MPNQKNNTPTKTLTLSFNLPIYPRQIKNWRGAFLQMAGWEDEVFHNHDNGAGKGDYHYRYPQIQYRIKNGKAAIFAINEGIPAIQKILATTDWKIEWEGESRSLQIEDLRMNEHYFRLVNKPKEYRVHKWMALTEKNYEKWQACDSYVARVQMIEKLLTNHLLQGLWGMGWASKERIQTNLLIINQISPVPYHRTQLLAFDVVFSSNVLIPSGMGIGKAVSHGFGVIYPLGVEKKENTVAVKQTSGVLDY
jgi:hypothetical protein